MEEPDFSVEYLTDTAKAAVAENRVPEQFLHVLKVKTVNQNWDQYRQKNPDVSLTQPRQFYLQRTLPGLEKIAKRHDDELEKDANFKGLKFRIW